MSQTRALVVKVTAPGSTLAEKHEAFEGIVRLFQDMAYACAYAVLGDAYLAEDAAQEAFIAAWRKLGQLREPEAFPGWFKRIVLTECNRLTRGKRLTAVPLEAGADVPALDADQQRAAEKRESDGRVFAAVESLPQRERVVTILFYVDGRSHKEIGEFLEVPTTTVAKRLHSARTRLKGLMTGSLKDDFEGRRPSRDERFADKVRRGIYDAYVGQYRYELRPDLVVTITREGDRLFSEAAGQRNELFGRGKSDTELRAKEFDGRGEFIRDARGQVTHFVYYECGREMGRAKKVS
ncbi:MAG TPA: sigma-70 family RNA polymerase sigma factor [Pyrinomonadaceae bacterium]|nr:sigma-70 family RNA polymerase sigma factor [Pyrinomonadaceae bacterium]